MGSRRNRQCRKAGCLVFTLVFAAMGIHESRAQVAVVARDPNNPYQKNRFGHIHRVFLNSFEYGGEEQSYLQESLKRYAKRYGFQLDIATSASYITEASLGLSGPDTANPVNVAVFNDGEGDVLSDAVSLAAMKRFVQDKGRGLYLIHAAAAYIPCPTSGAEKLTDSNCHWLARILVRQFKDHVPDPSYARIYVDSVRAVEIPPGATPETGGNTPAGWDHGKRVPEFKSIFDSLPSNNGVVGGPEPMVWDSLSDEWYDYRGYVRNQGAQTFDGAAFGPVIALLSEDEGVPYASTRFRMGDRVQSWARHVGLGLTAFNSMGHGSAYTRGRQVHGKIVQDSILEMYNWRVMRYLARDFVGCMLPNVSDYNPEASVFTINELDNRNPCGEDVVPIVLRNGGSHDGIRIAGRNIHISLPEKGEYRILVVDPLGKQYYNRAVVGGANRAIHISRLSKGQYYAHITLPDNSRTVTGVRLD